LLFYTYVAFIKLSFIGITLVLATCGPEALPFTGKNDQLVEIFFSRNSRVSVK